jgi:hypothetical protein
MCGNDPSQLVLRSERTEEDDNPAIHYGLVASANQFMKDASVRDVLAAENSIITEGISGRRCCILRWKRLG